MQRKNIINSFRVVNKPIEEIIQFLVLRNAHPTLSLEKFEKRRIRESRIYLYYKYNMVYLKQTFLIVDTREIDRSCREPVNRGFP